MAGTAGLFVLLLEDVTLDGVVDLGASVLLPALLVLQLALLLLTEDVDVADLEEFDLDDVGVERFCFNRLAFVEALRFSAIRCG